MRRDVFQAIADPIRRDIITLVANKPLTVNEVSEKFKISRPAISKHIKILEECGIVTIHPKGRARYCYIQPENLIPAFLWIEQYQKLWEGKIDAFEKYVIQLKNEKEQNE